MKECVHNARWKQKNAGYKLPKKWKRSEAAQLAICVSALLWLPRSELTHIASVLKKAFLCSCKRIWSKKTLQIIQHQRHVLISDKHKRTALQCWCYHSEDYSKKTAPHLQSVEIFFLSKLRVHERYAHLQWKDSFNSNWSQGVITLRIFFTSLLSQVHFHHSTCAQ